MVGYCPKLDLRSVHFKRLCNLTLGNFTFSHDWQLDWILGHGSTLERVSLRGCRILTQILLGSPPDLEGYRTDLHIAEVTALGHLQSSCSWAYRRCWSHYFNSFSDKLLRLRRFNFGDGDNVNSRMQPVWEYRYSMYDSQEYMNHYVPGFVKVPETSRYSQILWTVNPDRDEEDYSAYVRLLMKIGQEVPEKGNIRAGVSL